MASENSGWFNTGSSPTIQVKCEVELSRSGTTVTVDWTVRMKMTSSSSYLGTGYLDVYCSCAGENSGWQNIKPNGTAWRGTSEHSVSGSFTFNDSNTSADTWTVHFESRSNQFRSSGIFSRNLWCEVEGWAAYFSKKPTLTLVSKTETTATFSWSTSEACSQVQYKINNTYWVTVENNINKRSGTYTITGLSPNTSYKIYGDFRRRDTSQWSSDVYNVYVNMQTYNYPNCLSGNNFVIGQPFELQIDNPLGKTYDLTITLADNTTFTDSNLTTTTYTGFNDSTSITKLYQSITNSNSGNYSVTITTDTPSSIIKSNAGQYSVGSESDPIFSDFDYEDTNTNVSTGTTRLTGDSTTLIEGYSTVKAIVSTSNKAVAQNYATMTNYKFVLGNETPIIEQYSDNSNVELGDIPATSNVLQVYAIDSRGNTGSPVTKTLEIGTKYIRYEELTISSISVSRDNGGAGEDVEVDINGTFWNNTFGGNVNAVTNHIKSITYQYKETNSSTWVNGTTSITATESSEYYSFSGNIAGDLGSGDGFNISKSFNIKFIIQDELSTKTFETTIQAGTPAIAITSDNKVSIGAKFDPQLSGTLQVNGDINFKDTQFLSLLDFFNSSNTEIVSNTNGTALKFGNGIMICYKVIELTLSITGTWGSLYESSQVSLGDFPVAFIEEPITVASVGKGSNGGWIEYILGTTTAACGITQILRASSITNGKFNIHLVAIGKWK